MAGTRPSPDGFDALYERQFARLVTALQWAGADPGNAEDLAQEAFVRTLLRWTKVHDPAAYAFRVGFRLLSRWRRRASIASRANLANLASRRMESPPADDAVLHRSAVDAALAQLSTRQRECAVLHHYLGCSTEEVGRILGIRASTVRVHLHEARRALSPPTTAPTGTH